MKVITFQYLWANSTCDGSGSTGWVNFFVALSWVSHLCMVWVWKICSTTSNFSIFFTSGQKKSSWVWLKGNWVQDRLASYLLRVRAICKLYSATAVWYSSITIKLQKKIEILHYKAFRIAIKDYGRLFPREMLYFLGRQRPNIIDEYLIGSVFINCCLTVKPSRPYAMIKENEYQIRWTGQLRYFDRLSATFC